jgi:hypothetical protein
LRIFRIEPNRDAFLVDSAIDFDFSGSGAGAFRIMTKQNTENPKQSIFKIDWFGWLLSQIVGALRGLHMPLDYRPRKRS